MLPISHPSASANCQMPSGLFPEFKKNIASGVFSIAIGAVTVAICNHIDTVFNVPAQESLARSLGPDKYNEYLDLRQDALIFAAEAAVLSFFVFFANPLDTLNKAGKSLYDRVCSNSVPSSTSVTNQKKCN
ncbi:hypothetical protein J7438_13320 [Thalassotalea sp. G20_0]|uniref:hypothetical protein n=1 Tax=Thalassotalea sp. G20_0 TaxID=2821093 RepID=UPI001ADC5216|nr:hypothetical protein [Thalassotalea sp. G20_0]MBO9495059.1 hypothetical protein [Thalassotalea sp. G20_0]